MDIRPPTPGLFSFNNPLGACPECRGFGRTIAIDLNKAIPNRSLSIKQGVVRVFRGAEFGESQKDLLRACAREDIDINVPFEELPKPDQDFVIEGEKRSGEYTEEDYEYDRWYGVRGFFRWLESKTYKMHVRVLLSRYRAYITCPKCKGGRHQPEALNYKIQGAAVSSPPKAGSAGKNGSAGGGSSASEFAWYGNMLHDRFYSAWIQPTNHVPTGAKISTLVKVRIEKDGRVSKFEIIKPSENAVVNESVAAVAKQVTEVDSPPAGLIKGDHYDVKINFELNTEEGAPK